jgi:arylsulfatase A-like enzyme
MTAGHGKPWLTLMPLLAVPLLGCVPTADDAVLLDLVESFHAAEVLSERSEIDLGTDSARPNLESGWSWNEVRRDGTTFVWSTGSRSSVRVFCTAPRDLVAWLRCAPFRFKGAPTQEITVGLNGHDVAKVELKPGMHEYGIALPSEMMTVGTNRMDFRYRYHRRVSEVRDSGDRRSLAVAWDGIRFDGMESARDPGVAGEHNVLLLPFGVELAFYVNPPRGARFSLRKLRSQSGRGGHLEIWWRVDGSDGLCLARLGENDRPMMVELPADGEAPRRLAIRAVGEGEGGLELVNPTLRGSGNGMSAAAAVGPPVPAAGSAIDGGRPNVLIYLVDTLRADRLGCFGHDVGVSPHIDALAADGVLFEHTVSQSSWTKPAVTTIMTGLGPLSHGVNGRLDMLPSEAETIAELLRDLGYWTAGFAANAYITEDAGFAQGFDDFDFAHSRSGAVTEKVLGWLGEHAAESPFFLYVHTIDPHAPYEPAIRFREEFASGVSDLSIGGFDHIRALGRNEIEITDALVEDLLRLYDAEVAENDHAFGMLLDGLRDLGMYDDTLIVFVSDHGEQFHEHGVFGHGWDLYQEVLDVPMIIRPPGGRSPIRVSGTAQLVDLPATVLSAVGAQIPEGFEGSSLWSFVEGTSSEGPRRPAIAYMDYEGREGITVLDDGWKLIEPLSVGFVTRPELYLRGRDHDERKNLLPDFPVRAGYLASLAKTALANRSNALKSERLSDFDAEKKKALEALGYLR